jgi:putative ABC transport system permease protein
VSLALSLALRDLRGGLSGLRLLAVCLFLGVAAIAAVGSLSSSIVAGLSAQGQTILGGDVQMEVAQRQADPAERAAFAAEGEVAETVQMRAMAIAGSGESLLIEIKGVDARWPLYGAFTLEAGATAPRPAGNRVAIAPALADRLDLKIGSRFKVGEADFEVMGLIANEPDRIGDGFTLGPVVLADMDGVAATQLIQPGSLFTAKYKIKTPARVDPGAVGTRLVKQFPSAGWDADDRSNGAPGTRRFIERLGQFLSLVGLTALIVAGIGVGNGVSSWLETKRPAIATMKALGAPSKLIAQTYLIQIALVSAGAMLLGLIAGALAPWAVATAAGDLLPVPPELGLYPWPLLLGLAFGLLTALLFAVVPLSRAKRVAAASLFRGGVEALPSPARSAALAAILLAIGIGALAIGSAREPRFAAIFVAGSLAVLGLLLALGATIRAVAKRSPRPRRPIARLALGNLYRPGAKTVQLVVALGLGMTLFGLLAVIESNFARQLQSNVPERAPSFFILDIPSTEVDQFRGLVETTAPGAGINMVPSLRGPVVAVKDMRVSDMTSIPDDAWILRGDRGLTFAAELPQGNRIVSGQWWPKDYSGPPLVSIDDRAARALSLKPGDSITISVLGVEIAAEIASTREINWDSLGFNFAMIFSPGSLEGAPYTYMATVDVPQARETALNRAMAQQFPSSSMVRVKDVIGQVGALMGQLASAVRVASMVAVLAGIAVLIGAVAAARRARIYDAVILKTLGGSRRQVLIAQALEYALLAVLVSGIAFAISAVGGWLVVTETLQLEWDPDWLRVIVTMLAGGFTVIALGMAGSLPALAARPAQVLREL